MLPFHLLSLSNSHGVRGFFTKILYAFLVSPHPIVTYFIKKCSMDQNLRTFAYVCRVISLKAGRMLIHTRISAHAHAGPHPCTHAHAQRTPYHHCEVY
jgi:hypothetical protein